MDSFGVVLNRLLTVLITVDELKSVGAVLVNLLVSSLPVSDHLVSKDFPRLLGLAGIKLSLLSGGLSELMSDRPESCGELLSLLCLLTVFLFNEIEILL